MKFKITQECGQKWYRPSSWRRRRFRKIIRNGSTPVGVAYGPIMFFWN